MGLRSITIHRTTVKYREDTIELRGISAPDLMTAMRDFAPQMAVVFAQVTSGEAGADIKSAIMNLSKEFPELLAATIALASDEYDPESVQTALNLPFNVQIECLEAIFAETFTSEADVKKLVESLSRIIAATSGALEMNLGPLSSALGTGASGVS